MERISQKMLFVPLSALKAKMLDCEHHFGALWAMMTYMLFPVVFSRIVGVRAPHILTLQDGDPYEKFLKDGLFVQFYLF